MTMRISPFFQDAKVDVERVLGSLGIIPERQHGHEFICWCIFHRENKTPNMQVHSETGLWQCWVCGSKGNLPSLVAQVHDVSYQDALKELAGFSSIPTVREIRERNLRDLEKKLKRRADLPIIDITPYKYGSSWWYRFGGFDKEIVRQYSLGFDSRSARAVIPVSYGNRWVGLIKRATHDWQDPRYWYSPGFERGRILYPWDHVPPRSQSCIVVEGSRDALRLHSYGITTALASLGSGITNDQAILLAETFDEVTFFLDNDVAGHIATLPAAELMSQIISRVYVAQYVVDKKDPESLTKQEALKSLKRRVNWLTLI